MKVFLSYPSLFGDLFVPFDDESLVQNSANGNILPKLGLLFVKELSNKAVSPW